MIPFPSLMLPNCPTMAWINFPDQCANNAKPIKPIFCNIAQKIAIITTKAIYL
uniref:Uncharacterized protein n=1 Tax=Romanomermis culicivorax TaxID=13658 RepID=A0A915JF84_ROMCU